MSDHERDGGPDPGRARNTATGRAAGGRSPVRRHLLVLGIGVAALILGIVLVVTGRSSSDGTGRDPVTAGSSTVPTGGVGPLLPDLGTVPDDAAARALVGDLDPDDLSAGTVPADTDPTTTTPGVDLTDAAVQRCGQAISQQNTDRSLGEPVDAARLSVGDTAALVVSYAMPASGELPAADRVLVVDARTCRVLTAVEH